MIPRPAAANHNANTTLVGGSMIFISTRMDITSIYNLSISTSTYTLPTIEQVSRRRVIGDFRGYRRLIAYIAVFDREGVVRCW